VKSAMKSAKRVYRSCATKEMIEEIIV